MAVNLKRLVSQGFRTMSRAVKDVTEAITYKHDTVIGRSGGDGRIGRTTTEIAVPRAVFAGYQRHEMVSSQVPGRNTAIQPEDLKCLIPSQDLGLSVVPTPHDRLVRADGSTWNIISVKTDPAQALWTLQIRRP